MGVDQLNCLLLMKKYIALFLGLFLPVSIMAKPRPTKNSYLSWERTRLSLDLGLGIPWGVILGQVFKEFEIGKFKAPLQVNPHARINCLVGYEFPISVKRRVGLEVGLGYTFNKVVAMPNLNMRFKEQHLYIPLSVSFTKLHNMPFYFSTSVMLGYEFDILLTAQYQQSGYYPGLHHSFHGDKNLKELAPKFSRIFGNVLLASRFDFPQGIYAKFIMKLPTYIVEIASLLEKKEREDELNSLFVGMMRLVSEDFIEIHLGLNFMDLVYTKDGLDVYM